MTKKNTLCDFISTIILSFLIFGSGVMKIQSFGFLILFLFLFFDLVFFGTRKILNLYSFVGFLFLGMCITISAAIGVFHNVAMKNAVIYNFSMYLFVIMLIAVRFDVITYKGYMNAITIFSMFSIILTLAGIFDLLGGRALQSKVLTVMSGMDGQKPIAGVVMQGFYLQGTLAIVPACVFFLQQKRYLNFFITFFALSLALSRFGLITVILCYGLINRKKFFKFLVLIFLFFFIGFLLNIPIIISLLEVFSGKDSGMSIRVGHLRGVLDVLNDNPSYFLFGQGPGSEFYSYGFNTFTETIELSHFDFIRKYGIFATMFLFLAILLVALFLISKTDDIGKGLGFGVIGHFIVAASNPVLLSIPFVCYFAICLDYYLEFNKGILRPCAYVHS